VLLTKLRQFYKNKIQEGLTRKFYEKVIMNYSKGS
jgi:hypothetical protein